MLRISAGKGRSTRQSAAGIKGVSFLSLPSLVGGTSSCMGNEDQTWPATCSIGCDLLETMRESLLVSLGGSALDLRINRLSHRSRRVNARLPVTGTSRGRLA